MLRWLFDWFGSETAKSLVWLLENEPQGWRRGSHSIAHPEAGVGIWIGNSTYGLHVVFDVPKGDGAHVLNGKRQDVGWLDRRVLYRAAMNAPVIGGQIPAAILRHVAMTK